MEFLLLCCWALAAEASGWIASTAPADSSSRARPASPAPTSGAPATPDSLPGGGTPAPDSLPGAGSPARDSLLRAAPPARAASGPDSTAGGPSAGRPAVRAVWAARAPEVDGSLDDPAWQGVEPFTSFLQKDPDEGEAATLLTEVRVVYDDRALYVGARMHDPAPDSIVARLARRDQSVESDRFGLYLDPYRDHRSGYYFMINAAGTLYDGTLFNDVGDDKSWDGVWEAKAKRDAQGWTAEMAIPYSQLRFEPGTPLAWGINFSREIPRRREADYTAFRPHKESGFVSRFPALLGDRLTGSGRSIELMPYVSTKSERAVPEPGDPFHDGSRTRHDGGLDARLGIGKGLTLNATVNPDFGQVEVDPSEVNLTEFESFFEEKRPFFTEGASTFDFGRQGAGDYWDYDWDDPLFFYSRRIGREPQGKVRSVDFEDAPVTTRILGAAKLLGRLGPGWTLGALGAVTRRETERVARDSLSWRAEIEPLAGYGVVRTQRQFADRRLGIGLMGTAVVRSFDDPTLRDQFDRTALLGGVDGWLFLDPRRTWVVSGWHARSRVEGTPARMIALQRSSTRYYQRPDAGYLGVDSAATALEGHGSRWWLNKEKGAVQFNAGYGVVSPGFEVNDLGYQKRADLVNAHVGLGYKWTKTGRLKKYASAKVGVFETRDNGGTVIGRGVKLSGYTEFRNRLTTDWWAGFAPQTMSNRLTRGGPLALSPREWTLGGDAQTNTANELYGFAGAAGTVSEAGSWYVTAYPGIEWRPAARFALKISPGWSRTHADAQYVTSRSDTLAGATYGRRYVFSQLDQTTLYTSLRLSWAFTPALSLETYAQPYFSSGRYHDFRSLVRPRTYDFEPFAYSGSPDFAVGSLKGDAVLRWEYRPGATLYLVWTQKRSDSDPYGVFQLGPSIERLGQVRPQNVYMAKLSYYFTP